MTNQELHDQPKSHNTLEKFEISVASLPNPDEGRRSKEQVEAATTSFKLEAFDFNNKV